MGPLKRCLYQQMILFLYFLIKRLDFNQDLTGDAVCKLKGGTGNLHGPWERSLLVSVSVLRLLHVLWCSGGEFNIVSKN